MDTDRVHITLIVLNTMLFAAVLILSMWVYMLLQKKPPELEKKEIASSLDSGCLFIPQLNGKSKYSFITKVTRGNLEDKVELNQASGLTIVLSDGQGVSNHLFPSSSYKNLQLIINNEIVPFETISSLNKRTHVQIEETFDMSKTTCPNLQNARIIQINE